MSLSSDISTFAAIESYIKFNSTIRLGNNVCTTFIVNENIQYVEYNYISNKLIIINNMRAQLSIINDDGYDKYKLNNNCKLADMMKIIEKLQPPELKKQEEYYIERRIQKLCA